MPTRLTPRYSHASRRAARNTHNCGARPFSPLATGTTLPCLPSIIVHGPWVMDTHDRMAFARLDAGAPPPVRVLPRGGSNATRLIAGFKSHR